MERLTIALLYLPILVGGGLASCTTGPNPAYAPPPLEQVDTAKVKALIAMRDSMLSAAVRARDAGRLNPTIFDGDNMFNYLNIPPDSTILNCQLRSDTMEVQATFFLLGNALKAAHLRQWVKTSTPFAREVYYYFENGKPFFAEERSSLLQPGQLPVVVRDLPFMQSKDSLTKLWEDLEPWWELVLAKTAESAGIKHD